ncbi:unnamed protein product [Moneuplotes crassus]|uniref:Uncharacterized protein n=1 Tax=Euplotes crassus TaxID=5936 RepID=A0AAD1UL53_EUPCR|nr:unnamed protein product [Moneuplotes crassus]
MDTFHAQSFTSEKLVFSEEEDLFNTPNYFDQGYKEVMPDDNLFQDVPSLGLAFGNKHNDVGSGNQPNTYFDRICSPSEHYGNESCQADFGMSANSFHFHFDRLSNDVLAEKSKNKIGRTQNGILFQINDDEKSDKSAYDSTNARKTTAFTNIEEKHDNGIIPEQAHEFSDVLALAKDESLDKPSEPQVKSTNSRACDIQNSSKTPKSTKEDIDLSIRRDVVNKTVLRVMRRFFMQKFKDAYPKKFRSKEAKSKWYFEYIKKLTAELFGVDNPDLKVLQINMAAIINPKHMTAADITETGLEKEEFLTFYNTIYKYSHTRLASLFKITSLKTIFNYFYNGPMDQIINSETSVKKNSTLYFKAFEDFQRVFEGYTGDSSAVLEILCMNASNSTATLA